MREDINILQGDNVVFVKNKKGKWFLMTIYELRDKMESSKDIEETINESREGFKKKGGG